MPSDSSGNYTLPASYFVQNGDTVLPVQHNPPFEDVASGLTARVMKDGRTVWTGDMKAGGFRVTNLGAGTSDTDAANVLQVSDKVQAKADFTTVALMVADNNSRIGYSGSGARVIVAEGDIITAQGFRYEVAASDATDAHVETAGGVKMYVLAPYNVMAFGAKGDAITDDTAAILAAYTALKNQQLFYSLVFPMGRYVTNSSFLFEDLSSCTFVMEGATFIGAASGAVNSQPAIVEFRNARDFKITGPWWVTMIPESGASTPNPNAYQSGVWLRAKPGGVLEPTNGIMAYVDIEGLTAIRCGTALRIGERDNDAKTSEINFHGYTALQVVNALHIAGSQTVACFNGGTMGSAVVDTITNATTNATIIQYGGALTCSGGSVMYHADPTGRMILMRPAESAAFGNPYGQVNIIGATVEASRPLLSLVNQFGLTDPESHQSKFSLIGCTGGYIGGIPLNASPIVVSDTDYAGEINIPDGQRFYATLGASPRTSANVSAAGNTKVRLNIGKQVFDQATGFRAWPYGVVGGRLTHPMVLSVAARLVSQTIPSGAMTTVTWGNNPPYPASMGRYTSMLNGATGEITVPDAGVRFVRVVASVVLASSIAKGNIVVSRNGVVHGYGVLMNGVALIDMTIPDPVVDEVITVRVQLDVASDLSANSRLAVYLET